MDYVLAAGSEDEKGAPSSEEIADAIQGHSHPKIYIHLLVLSLHLLFKKRKQCLYN
jgi:hypothetical protein